VGEPILGKARQDKRDHRPMTWRRFLLLREWAQRVALDHGVGVYLVGSVLTKTLPRDVDVAVVWPEAEFVRLFGPIPPNSLEVPPGEKVTPMWRYLDGIYHVLMNNKLSSLLDPQFGLLGLGPKPPRIDIHFCPDTWWTDKDRLPLAGMATEQGAAGGEGTTDA
jgi:hypothetical protein